MCFGLACLFPTSTYTITSYDEMVQTTKPTDWQTTDFDISLRGIVRPRAEEEKEGFILNWTRHFLVAVMDDDFKSVDEGMIPHTHTPTNQNHKSNWYWRSNFVPWALESNQEKACCKKVQKSKWLRKSLNLVQNYSEFRLKYGPMSWIWSWNSHEFGPTKWLWKTQWNTSVCVRLFSGQTLSHKWGWS